MKTAKQETKQGVERKMIQVRVNFLTNDLPPKHGWTKGFITIAAGAGIHPTNNPLIFRSLMDIPSVIEDILMKNEVKLHPSDKMKKYIANE
jgi:hypothetical protein